MKTYVKTLAVVTLLGFAGFLAGCDQNDAVTQPEISTTVSKGSGIDGLGQRLGADPDFRMLRKLLIEADRRARLKYATGANLKADLAFAKIAAKKKVHTAAERARLARIRGLSEKDLDRVGELRKAIVEKYPEILTLTEHELHDVLQATGLGSDSVVGKTLDKCSDCTYAYNSCSTSAEISLAMSSIACTLLLESIFAAGSCYLAAFSKYMWTISGCRQKLHYCLSANGCGGTALNDTI